MTKESIDVKVKDSYMKLLRSGMFFEFYPDLTGEWEEDKDFWYEEYHNQMELLKNK